MKKEINLKQRWLNWMLHFSGVIHKYKLKVIESTGPKVILYGFFVLILEIINFCLALPAYAFISSREFAGNDSSVIKVYRLRRIVSLSVIAGMVFSVFVWILVSFFGLVLFPGHSSASVASWDFNTPLAYNYDTTKIQITDGVAIFKAQVSAPVPVVAPAPASVVEPAPSPVVEPAPTPAPSPLIFNNLRQIFNTQVAHAQTNTCSATLQTITPLLVTPFVKWTGFSEIANKNAGEIYYTLSGDGGLTWLYWNGSSWIDAGTNKGNTALVINNHISDFPITLTETSAGTLMFKATFESDCNQDISLLSLTVDYQGEPSVIASFTSPETSTATTTTVVTSEATPTIIAVADSISVSTGIITTVNTSVDLGVSTPIAFSVHIVTKTTGTPGSTLYSISGLLSLSLGPDNGLLVNVTGTDLQTTTLSYPNTTSGSSGSSADVAVGDHLVVLVYDGAILKLYIDGMVVASISTPIVILPPAQVSTSVGCVSAGFILEAITLAQVNANYLECNNQMPQLNITSAVQKTGDSFINISYTTTDADNDFVSLSTYEYSTSGEFMGEERTMTAVSLSAEHDGIGGLVAQFTGTKHMFVWNAKADIPNYSGNVYVRLRASDGLIAGPAETFYPVWIDTKAPGLSVFGGVQTNDSGNVTFTYVLNETSGPVQSALTLSSDGGLTWIIPTISASGSVGEITGTNQTITWNADAGLPNFEGIITARLTSTDAYGNTSVTTTNFMVDTRVPIGLMAFRGVESNTNQILWRWSPSDDMNFDRYIITYGTDRESVVNGSVDNRVGVELWGPSRDSDFLIAGTDRTVTTGLSPDTEYFAKITAYDDYGHEQTSVLTSFRTQAENVIVGEVLPNSSTLLPSTPVGGFRIVINEGTSKTENRNVALALTGGVDAVLMLISNNSDLSGASLQEYASSTIWNVCEGLDSCENGTYRIYVKFYTSFGVGGAIVSDSIILNVPVDTSAVADKLVSVGNGTTGGGSGPIISLLTNESRERSSSLPEASTDAKALADKPANQNGNSVQSAFISTADSILQNTPELKSIALSRESGVLAKPEVSLVKKSFTGKTINFEGSGIPNAKVALFIHSDQVVVYTTDADRNGRWSFSHNQEDIELAPGEHTVFAVTYDLGSKVKSKPSLVSTFYVKKSPAAVILAYTNLPTTLLTLVVLLFGTVYIYSRRKEVVK